MPAFSTLSLLELTSLLVFWLLASACQRAFQIPARRLFVGLALACGAWCIGDLARLSGELDPINAERIACLGTSCFGFLWLALGARAADLAIAPRATRLGWILAAPPLATYALLFNASRAHLYLSIESDGKLVAGPVLFASSIYFWALVAIGSGLFLMAALRPDAGGRWWLRLTAALAGFVLIAVDAVSVLGGNAMQFELAPVAAGIALWMLHIAIFSGGLLGALPTARFELIDLIPMPLLVSDRYGAVVASNPAARARLGVDEHDAQWRRIDSLLATGHDRPEVETLPLLSANHEVGALVMLDPEAKAATRSRASEGDPGGTDDEREVES